MTRIKVIPDSSVRRSGALLGLVVIGGTLGYVITEGWGVWDALFFTLVTITTVGYGDYGLSDNGERFTAVVMLLGIGSLTYAASQFVKVVVEGHLNRSRCMQRAIDRLSDHIIVCGLDPIGLSVCRELMSRGEAVCAISANEADVEVARDQGITAMCGDPTLDDALARCGLIRAARVVAASSEDHENIVVALSARSISPTCVIVARAHRPESIPKLYKAGANRVLSPTLVGATRLAHATLNPDATTLLEPELNDDDALCVREIRLVDDGEQARTHGTIADLGQRFPSVVFVSHINGLGTQRIRPPGGQELLSGERLVLAGRAEDLDEIASAMALCQSFAA